MSGFGQLPKVDGPITKAIRAGLRLREQLLADGTSQEETDRIVGQGLKAVLGHPNAEEGLTFTCHKCQDTGWLNVEPSHWEMKRLVKLYGPNPLYQQYQLACDPCRYREKQREERRRQAGNELEEGFVSAGQTRRRGR